MKSRKRLVLKKETLRTLNPRQLKVVNGGATGQQNELFTTDFPTECSCDTLWTWTWWVDDTVTIRYGSQNVCVV